MITKSDLEVLNKYKTETGRVLSVYLDVDQSNRPEDDHGEATADREGAGLGASVGGSRLLLSQTKRSLPPREHLSPIRLEAPQLARQCRLRG